MLIHWISTYNWLSYSISESINLDLASENNHSTILTWPIFEGGLSDVNIDDFLTKDAHGWIYKQIPLPEPSDFSVEELKKALPATHQEEVQMIFASNHKIYHLIKDMRKLQGYSERYSSEKLRPNFKPADKKYWENIEAILLYAMLYHTHDKKELVDIIHLNDVNRIENSYVIDQLKVYGRKINEVLNWMLKQVQTIKEKQHALEDVIEMKAKLLNEKQVPVEEKKTVKVVIPKKKANVKRMSLAKPKAKSKKIEKPPVVVKKIELDAKDKENVLKYFTDRLSGNVELIKDLCGSFGVTYEEGVKSINELFEKIWNQSEDTFPNPYQKVANNVFLRLLLILRYNPCYEENTITKLQSEEEELLIPVLKRAHTEENSHNLEKIAEMRKWVDSYKKWKDWNVRNAHHIYWKFEMKRVVD